MGERDVIMEKSVGERGVPMETAVLWERGIIMATYNGGEGRYHGYSTMEVGALPWKQSNGGKGLYHGMDTAMWERGITMDTVQWGRGMLPWRRYNGG